MICDFVLKVLICVFPGVEELDFVGFIEPLAVANRVMKTKYFEYAIAGTEDDPIICSGGMRVQSDVKLYELNLSDYDLLFMPGGGASTNSGVTQLIKDKDMLVWIKEAYDRGKPIWSVCTGALVLAEAGLLNNRFATTHHNYLSRLKDYGAKVSTKRIVRSGRITTAGGISSSIDLGLELVKIQLGKKIVTEVRNIMEYMYEH
jgi:transcriptional regulator GlxA family with amidase domain